MDNEYIQSLKQEIEQKKVAIATYRHNIKTITALRVKLKKEIFRIEDIILIAETNIKHIENLIMLAGQQPEEKLP